MFCTGTLSEDVFKETPSLSSSEVCLFISLGYNCGLVSLCNIVVMYNITLLVDCNACGEKKIAYALEDESNH